MNSKRVLVMLTTAVLLVGACSSSDGDASDGGEPVETQSESGSSSPEDEPAGAGTISVTVDGEDLEMALEDCNTEDNDIGGLDVLAMSTDGQWEFFMQNETAGISSGELGKAWRSKTGEPSIFEVTGSAITGEGDLPPYGGAPGDNAAISFDIAC